jgi:hypothetical protein
VFDLAAHLDQIAKNSLDDVSDVETENNGKEKVSVEKTQEKEN